MELCPTDTIAQETKVGEVGTGEQGTRTDAEHGKQRESDGQLGGGEDFAHVRDCG